MNLLVRPARFVDRSPHKHRSLAPKRGEGRTLCNSSEITSPKMTQRLFIAIDLPLVVRQTLANFQPDRFGLRPVAGENMHLTLHFLGMAEPPSVIEVLSQLEQVKQPFEMNLRGLGYFFGRDRGLILWTGVEENIHLSQLHAELADRLRLRGFEIEKRTYHPHVTLARGNRTRPAHIKDFLEENRSYTAAVQVTGVRLYSSELTKQGPKYSLVHEHQFGEPS